MIKFYKVTPISVVFFRDPRPFSAGEQTIARLQFPPRLTPFLGALRTKFLEKKAREENKPIPEIVDKHKKSLEDISIVWFSFLRENQPVFHLPFDTFTNWKSLTNERFIFENQNSEGPNQAKIPIWTPEIREKSPELATLTTIEGFIYYSEGITPPKDNLLFTTDLWDFENRIGITLKHESKTTERTKLYRLTVARPKPGVGFLVGVNMGDSIAFPDSFTTRLGGEAHIALWEKVGWIKAVNKQRKFRELLALTHIPIKSESVEQIYEVENWCVNKLDIISGWDYQKRKPKPLIKALKPGTVISVKPLESTSPPETYEIEVNGKKTFVVKDLMLNESNNKLFLVKSKPELGEPNSLFLIKK